MKSQAKEVKMQKKKIPAKATKQSKPAQKQIEKINKHEIDATDKVLGRVATEIANILRGKNKPSYRPNILCGDRVVVINAKKIILTGKKIEQKIYQHHTGYLGHLKVTTAKELMAKNPAEVLRRAVFGMLPKNKLRDIWMKNLTIEN